MLAFGTVTGLWHLGHGAAAARPSLSFGRAPPPGGRCWGCSALRTREEASPPTAQLRPREGLRCRRQRPPALHCACRSTCRLVTLPLTVIGGIVGRNMAKGKDFDAPCRTNKVPREVPPIPWYRQGPCQVFMAGFLPFSAIYIELHYIFASVWGHKLYTLYGILFIAFLMLVIVTSFITIALTYFQLAIEDHRWWWRALFSGGSTGFFIYAYCFFYYFERSGMFGFMQARHARRACTTPWRRARAVTCTSHCTSHCMRTAQSTAQSTAHALPTHCPRTAHALPTHCPRAARARCPVSCSLSDLLLLRLHANGRLRRLHHARHHWLRQLARLRPPHLPSHQMRLAEGAAARAVRCPRNRRHTPGPARTRRAQTLPRRGKQLLLPVMRVAESAFRSTAFLTEQVA